MKDDNYPDVVIQPPRLLLENPPKTPADRELEILWTLGALLASSKLTSTLIIELFALTAAPKPTTQPPITSDEAMLRPYDAQMTEE